MYLITIVSGEDYITLPGEVQVKDEPFSDVQIESVFSISSALFSEINEVVGKVKRESEQDSLREVKLELNDMSEQENKDGVVCTFVKHDNFDELHSLFDWV